MKTIFLAILILLGQQAPIARLTSLLDVVEVSASPNAIAGKYTDGPKEITDKAGPALSGCELYLFPSGSYIYVEWADIMSPTIYDRGTWQLSDGRLKLQSNKAVTWATRNEDEFSVIRRRASPNEVLLVGLDRHLDRLETNLAKPDADREFFLLLASLVKESSISTTEEQALKLRLLAESWHPEFHEDP